MSHVEFSYGSATLVANGPTFLVFDWLDLYRVGESRGSNFVVAGVAGTAAKDRLRGELGVELAWQVSGWTIPAGTATTAGLQGKQVRANVRWLTTWFDAAPGRQLTVKLVDDEMGTWTAPAQFETFGRIDWSGPTVQVRQLLTLNEGAMTEVVAE